MNAPRHDIFHDCALAAYVDVIKRDKQNPPDSESVRVLAYKYYEDYLKNPAPATQ